ncbi:MAG: hypothetical protein QM564_12265 [Bergeyella sp.]
MNDTFIGVYSMACAFLFSGILSFELFKLLRNKIIFNILLIISITIIVIAICRLDFGNKNSIIQFSFAVSNLLFLYFYKVLDKHYLKKYNRHLIFAPRYNLFNDPEQELQSFKEIFYQVLFLMFPMLVAIILDKYL